MTVIDKLVRGREAAWIETRRDLHRHPELGFTELRTASRVAQGLSDLDFSVRVGAQVMDASAMRRVQAHGGNACYFIIGSDLSDFHHTSHFDFDERSIAVGVRLFAGLAEKASAAF